MTTSFITDLQENYDRVVNYFGTGFNQRFIMSLASQYTLDGKQFSGVQLNKAMSKIVEKSKSLRLPNESSVSYKIAHKLMGEGDLEASLRKLEEKDCILNEAGFKKSFSRIVGAFLLEEDATGHAKRAKLLFDELNRRQRLLTSKEDIPYMVILTSNSAMNPSRQADMIVRYYHGLRKELLFGNQLQTLSQLMTLYSEEYNELFLQYVIELHNELMKQNVKVKRMHYPYIGILALTATSYDKVEEIVQLHHQLINQKTFRLSKELALIVAIQKSVQDIMELQSAVDMISVSGLSDIIFTADIVLEIVSTTADGLGFIFELFN